MDKVTDPFAPLRQLVSDDPLAGSSDFDLNPSVKAQLPKNRILKPASVLIPLIERDSGIQVILTRRANHLKNHAGQVAFPGGKVDASDASAQDAALREAHEEIGLPPQNVEILGAINRHETVTQFRIIPFLGHVHTDFTAMPEPGEVAEVFEVPLRFLMESQNYQIHSRNWLGVERRYDVVPYGPHFIWGATARILKGMADRVTL